MKGDTKDMFYLSEVELGLCSYSCLLGCQNNFAPAEL